MNENNTCCPDMESITAYIHNTLPDSAQRSMEEHFFTCSRCTDFARQASLKHSKQRVTKANPLLGKAWEKYGDAVEAKAAGENQYSKLRELMTHNGKFKITLRPLEKNPSLSLLEIEVFDSSIKGQLKISGISHFNEIAQIDENDLACIIVSSTIDLSRLLIQKHE